MSGVPIRMILQSELPELRFDVLELRCGRQLKVTIVISRRVELDHVDRLDAPPIRYGKDRVIQMLLAGRPVCFRIPARRKQQIEDVGGSILDQQVVESKQPQGPRKVRVSPSCDNEAGSLRGTAEKWTGRMFARG